MLTFSAALLLGSLASGTVAGADLLSRRSTTGSAIAQVIGEGWIVNVTFGDQTLKVLVDTGSADL
jgi:hypothetical protein